jgi:glycine cleavage system transcriptional repressor
MREPAHYLRVRTFSLSAVGADRPGIIAAVAEQLVTHGVNVTDSQMGILRGFFAMTLVVTAPDDVDEDALASGLRSVGEQLHLDTLVLRAVPDKRQGGTLDEPTHVVSVHGADHPGILHAITTALAGAGVNVCDLRTRLTPDGVWAMVIHIACPEAADVGAIEAALRAVGEREGVGVTLHAAEADLM